MNLERVDDVLPQVGEDARIGILGGTFDPPHLGHAMMALAVLMTQDIDRIWVIPCPDHVFKEDLTPFIQRVDWCEKTFRHVAGADVVEVEDVLPKPSYTLQTLQAIRKTRPEADLFFIVGSDLVEEIPSWTNAEGLTDLARFIIVPRQGYPRVEPPPEAGDPIFVEIGLDLPELASSWLDKLRGRGVSIRGFVERDVHRALEG